MAERKNTSPRESLGGAGGEINTAAVENAEMSLADKLKAAEEGISKMKADSKARESEKEKAEKKAEAERAQRSEEAQKEKEESEKRLQLLKEHKLAALEYAENYRKKLKKDKERAETGAKLRAREEREAKEAELRAKEAERIALLIEQERAEAQARAQRAEELYAMIAAANAEAAEVAASSASAQTAAEPAAEEPAEAVENISSEVAASEIEAPEEKKEIVLELPEIKELSAMEELKEKEPEEEAVDAYEEDKEQILVPIGEESYAQNAGGSRIVLNILSGYAKTTVEEEYTAPVVKPEESGRVAGKVTKEKPEQYTPAAEGSDLDDDTLTDTRESWKLHDIPEFNIEDGIVAAIKAEGARVENRRALKKYLKHSKKAVKYLYKETAKTEKKSTGKKVEESAYPSYIVKMLNKLASVLEIRCDNISVTVKQGNLDLAEKISYKLSDDIDEYNTRAALFKEVTGESLTRVSPFLPDHLVLETGFAVIPKLAYRESYDEYPIDNDGNVILPDDNVVMETLEPPYTAEEKLGRDECEKRKQALKKAKIARKTVKRFDKEISKNQKTIGSNKKILDKSYAEEKKLLDAREKAVKLLNAEIPELHRDEKLYSKKLLSIDNKYGKKIIKIRERRASGGYEKANIDLAVDSFVLDREKVRISSALILSAQNALTPKEKNSLKTSLTTRADEYNASSEKASEMVGKKLSVLSSSRLAAEVVVNAKNYAIPKMTRRRELIEAVGEDVRIIGDGIKNAPKKVLEGPKFDGAFERDKTKEDRALSREDIMIKALCHKSLAVVDRPTYKKYLAKSKATIKKLKKTLKQTSRAMFKALDENGVYTGLAENIRILGKLVEARTVDLETAVRMKARSKVRKAEDELYDVIEKYNNRAIDYQKFTGEKLTRISAFLPENISGNKTGAIIPELSYRETYLEVYPNTLEAAATYADPGIRRANEYDPIDYKNKRITENATVEVTLINPPISAEDNVKFKAATTRAEKRKNGYRLFSILWRLDRALKKLKRRHKRNLKRAKKFDRELEALGEKYSESAVKLEKRYPESQRRLLNYRLKRETLNKKYHKLLIKLRYRRAAVSIERREMKFAIEEFVIRREKLEVYCAKLYNLRAYDNPKVIAEAKKDLIDTIRDHNKAAEQLSEMLEAPITRVSASVADEIIRSGMKCYLPKIILAREIMETVGERSRAVGDRFRFGMPYTINSQGIAVQTGTSIKVSGMGFANIGLAADGTPVLGATGTGFHFAGTPVSSHSGIARPNPVSAIKAKAETSTFIRDEKYDNPEAPLEKIDSYTETPIVSEIEKLSTYALDANKAKSRLVSNGAELFTYLKRSRRVVSDLEDILNDTNRTARKKHKDAEEINKELNRIVRKDNIKGALEACDALDSQIKKGLAERSAKLKDVCACKAELEAANAIKELYDNKNKDVPEVLVNKIAISSSGLSTAENALEYIDENIIDNINIFVKEYNDLKMQKHSEADTIIIDRYERYFLGKESARFLAVEHNIRCELEQNLLAVITDDANDILKNAKAKIRLRKILSDIGFYDASLLEKKFEFRVPALTAEYLSLAVENAESLIEAKLNIIELCGDRFLRSKAKDLKRTLSKIINHNGGYKKLYSKIASLEKQSEGSNVKKKDKKKEKSRLRKARAQIFHKFIEGRKSIAEAEVYKLRAIAARARYVDAKCSDLSAAAQVQLTLSQKLGFGICGLGFSPKKKARENLYSHIEKYNKDFLKKIPEINKEDHLDLYARTITEKMTTVSVLLPSALFERRGTESIPNLVYREQFAEVKLDKSKKNGVYLTCEKDFDGKDKALIIPINPVDAMKKTRKKLKYLDSTEKRVENEDGKKPLKTEKDFKKCIKEYKKKVKKPIDNAVSKLENEIEGVQDAMYIVRKRKIRAAARYQRALFRISKKTIGTVEYQRKMRRRLNRFRKKIYKLDKKERSTFSGGFGRYSIFSCGPAYGATGKIRSSYVKMLSLERLKLVYALRLVDKAFNARSIFGKLYVTKAQRMLTEALYDYNKCAEETAENIREKSLARLDNKVITKVMSGRLDEAIALIPKVACVRQLVEIVGDEKVDPDSYTENYVDLKPFNAIGKTGHHA